LACVTALAAAKSARDQVGLILAFDCIDNAEARLLEQFGPGQGARHGGDSKSRSTAT
jgi:hypothetical protein